MALTANRSKVRGDVDDLSLGALCKIWEEGFSGKKRTLSKIISLHSPSLVIVIVMMTRRSHDGKSIDQDLLIVVLKVLWIHGNPCYIVSFRLPDIEP
jgi:hypothetical protein